MCTIFIHFEQQLLFLHPADESAGAPFMFHTFSSLSLMHDDSDCGEAGDFAVMNKRGRGQFSIRRSTAGAL